MIVKRGKTWQVKWRNPDRSQGARTFDRKGDAEDWEAEFKRRRRLGPHLVAEFLAESMTLGAFVEGPWRDHAVTLEPPTQAKYRWALDRHLVELVDEPLTSIDARAIAAHQRLMLAEGYGARRGWRGERAGPASASTVREVMARLSGILGVADEWGHLGRRGNPARSVRNVPADVRGEIDALSPVELERVLAGLKGRDRAIVQLGGHFGLSPQEIRKVPCSALDGQLLTIGRAQTKVSRRRVRVIDGPAVAAHELRLWLIESGGRGAAPIVGPMSENAMRLWNRRVLRPAVEAATDGRIVDATATLLRHSHASACHHVATMTEPEILDRLGHGVQVHYQHYAGIIKAIRGRRFESLDELVTEARSGLPGDSVAPDRLPSRR